MNINSKTWIVTLGILVVVISIILLTNPESRITNNISILVAGDAIISQPWSHHSEPEFLALINEIRNADTAIANLETLIHSYNGYPQAESGGTWMASEPKIAQELAWAGFDMVGMANNHTHDYGAIGIQETISNLKNAGIVYAGAGKDLQHARSPTYIQSKTGTIALISISSTFANSGKAGRSRPDLHGRPGLNPLGVTLKYTIPKELAKKIQHEAKRSKVPLVNIKNDELSFYSNKYLIGEKFGENWIVDKIDLQENLKSIKQAHDKADIVIVSVHSHETLHHSGYEVPKFIQDFAHASIDNGADIFFSHGPHYIRGVEIYKDRPIFYGLGNFVFQLEGIEKQPADYYDQYGLDDSATPEDIYKETLKDDSQNWPAYPKYWESIVATVEFNDDELYMVRLIPVSLGFGKPGGERGRPLLADKEHARKLINKITHMSKRFGTEIEFENNIGVIK